MAFKAQMKKIANKSGLLPQQIQQSYLIERFLIKLARSEYSDQFIIKGGFLIESLIGIGSRATMDLDATIKGFDLNKETLTKIISAILIIDNNDSFALSLTEIESIREADNYPGYRIKIQAEFGYIAEQIIIDVTTGDRMTPSEIAYTYPLLFEDGKLQLTAYNLETILAEKIETLMSRREANTRPRDYYDLYILTTLFPTEIEILQLKIALQETAKKRGTENLIKDTDRVLSSIRNSDFQKNLWSKYQKQYAYAKELNFDNVLNVIQELLKKLDLN